MFTGIIENMGQVKEISSTGANKTYWIESSLSPLLKVDQSLAHDGVCLTIEDIQGTLYRVTAVAETLEKTNLNSWSPTTSVNLERSLLPSSRVDGHFVQGHVDTTARCIKIRDAKGSHEFQFDYPKRFSALVIEKGSICVNGVSLTAFKVKKNRFSVAVIPYTFLHTNLQFIKEGDSVNIEFDMIGKYILRKLSLKK